MTIRPTAARSSEDAATAAHGGDAEAVAKALGIDPAGICDLSASLNPVAPNVADVVRLHADRIFRYPEPTAATSVLAGAIGVEPERLVLTNGGSEAIALGAQLHPVGWVEDPEFSLYRRHLHLLEPGAPRWRSNPSNPFGVLAQPTEQAQVWDEAFYPLATGRWTRGDDSAWRLGSLTKVWSCPGLRLGYLIAPDPQAAADARAVQPEWSVNALALAVVEPLLAVTDLKDWALEIARRRGMLVDEMRARGLGVVDTQANWVLVRGSGWRQRLLKHRVLVRDCTSFGLPELARVALPDDAGLERLLTAIDACAR